MQLSIEIAAVGNTTAREISAATQDLRSALERLPGVERAEPARQPAPASAKGGVTDALGQLAVAIAPASLRLALQALRSALAPHPPTKVQISYKDTSISFEFDPKQISVQQLTDAAERLRKAAEPA
jgi:hypothetical protein